MKKLIKYYLKHKQNMAQEVISEYPMSTLIMKANNYQSHLQLHLKRKILFNLFFPPKLFIVSF